MRSKLSYFLAILFLILSFVGAYYERQVDTDFGKVEVTTITIPTVEHEPMVAKLYRPLFATPQHPVPGILALHGYQSDKEATTTFGALELARRGFVVLAIDQFGHGYSTKYPASNANILGANNGYQYLKTLPFVDKNELGIFGHSTGGLNTLRVAKLNPDHKALAVLSSKAGDPSLHNLLLVQGRYEEIAGYREHSFPVKDLIHNPTRLAAFSLSPTDTLQWDHTYGNFADGTARRADLVNGTHLGVMISSASNASVVTWFNQALQHGDKTHWIPADDQIYWYKEFAGLFALAFAIMSALALASGLLTEKFFAPIVQKIDPIPAITKSTWRKFAALNIVMSMVLYPIFTHWGGPHEPIAKFIPVMNLEMGNGIVLWITVSAIINLIFYFRWRKVNHIKPGQEKVKPTTLTHQRLASLGLYSSLPQQSTKAVVGKTALLTVILIAYLYAITMISYTVWHAELRFLWPLLKPLTVERAIAFPFYAIPVLFFAFVFNGLSMMFQMRPHCHGNFVVNLISWSAKSILVGVGGIFLLWCFEFIPDFMEIGPGWDVIGLPSYGGRWALMTEVIMPQFAVLLVINTWCYLRTGYVYLGSFLTGLLFTWTMVGGQVMGQFLG